MKRNKKQNTKNKETEDTKVYKVKKGKIKISKIIKISLLIILLVILITVGIFCGKVVGLCKAAKISVEDMNVKYENSVIKDIDGNVIAVLNGDENRESIAISEMAPYLPVAFVSIEDERFNEHQGVDIKRTTAATYKYALSKIGIGSANYGGSTITQQLVKNLTQEDERSWQRKVKEMARAYYLEQQISKDQILELYLNLIFLGGNTYGVEVASNYYFSKSARDLSLAECAYLAGINNSPNSYEPFSTEQDEIDRIKNRTKIVLNKMKELGKIASEEEYNQAIQEVDNGIKFQKGNIVQNVYSYHTDAAIDEIVNDLREQNPDWSKDYTELYVKSGGLTIYTTQNTTLQKAMEEEATKEKYQVTAKQNDTTYNVQAAMVLIDNSTGYVSATIGGLGEKGSRGLNRATQSTRQTGSSIKPIAVVAPGIDSGVLTAATVLDDIPTIFNGGKYTPKNYGYSYRGLITIRYAIESSENIPMVKGMQLVEPVNSIKFLKDLGITSLDDEKDNNLALALGGLTYGVSPLEMTAAYETIENNGVYREPIFYTKVVDSDDNVILENKQATRTVMSSAAAYVVKEILTQPVKTGTASYCAISGISVAAKTGTTNDDYDRWLCGFTPYYTGVTWFGYDTNIEIKYSGNPAGKFWDGVMTVAHEGKGKQTFSETKPEGVVAVTVCKCSGMLVTEDCQNDPRGNQTYTEYFVKGTAPKEYCTCHVSKEICNDTGKLANEYCTNKTKKVYITRPNFSEDDSWTKAKDAEYMLTVTEICDVHKVAPDKTAPIVKLNGSSTINLKVNEKYMEAGATASDDKDGDLTSKIVISGIVDIAKPGTYTITYTVADLSGNNGTATRTVIVEKVAETPSSVPNENSITPPSQNNTEITPTSTGNTINPETTNSTGNTTSSETNNVIEPATNTPASTPTTTTNATSVVNAI